jgi:hypothetical protein
MKYKMLEILNLMFMSFVIGILFCQPEDFTFLSYVAVVTTLLIWVNQIILMMTAPKEVPARLLYYGVLQLAIVVAQWDFSLVL